MSKCVKCSDLKIGDLLMDFPDNSPPWLLISKKISTSSKRGELWFSLIWLCEGGKFYKEYSAPTWEYEIL